MKVTVAICTWNRALLLRKTLEQFLQTESPTGAQWHLIVVDNNSSDDTASIVDSFQGKLPIEYALERKQGLSHARNHAISLAESDYLLFTDDDVLVARDWLVRYVEAFRRFPDLVYAGGTINPWYAEVPPAWVTDGIDLLEGPFAIRQFGPEARELMPHEEIFGANMAYRTDLLRRYQFDVTLGHQGSNIVLGEENDMAMRLKRDGHKGYWVGNASVQHFIPVERLTEAYIRKYFRGYGRTVQQTSAQEGGPTWFGYPRWALRRLATRRIRERVLRFRKGRAWLQSLIALSTIEGYLVGCKRP